MTASTSTMMTDEEIAEARSRAEQFSSSIKMLRDATPFDLAAFLACATEVSTDLDSLLATLQQRTEERDSAGRRAERAEALHASACIELDRVEAKLDGLEKRLKEVEAARDTLCRDAAEAAGGLPIPLDEMPPGSTTRKLVIANRLLIHERDRARTYGARCRWALGEMWRRRDVAVRARDEGLRELECRRAMCERLTDRVDALDRENAALVDQLLDVAIEAERLTHDLEAAHGDARLHRAEAHPDFEYRTRTGPPWDLYDPPAGDRWHRNIHRGTDGSAHIDGRNETYWMRPRAATAER